MVILAYGFTWQGVRAFYGRSNAAWIVVLCTAPWFLFSVFLLDPGQGSAVSSSMRAALIALFNGLAAYEFRRSRLEALPSRPVLFWIFVRSS